MRAGAALDDARKDRLRTINGELANLRTWFSRHAPNEVNESALIVDKVEALDGQGPAQIDAAAAEAASRGLEYAPRLP